MKAVSFGSGNDQTLQTRFGDRPRVQHTWTPARRYDIWHDRAVFHFLTEPAARDAYREALDKGLSPGGLLIIATFAPEGPERCSGLPVRRYDAETLAAELGPAFRLIEEWREQHDTPGGQTQLFNWCVFRRLERA